MSYQSPIEIIMSNMQMYMEGEIYKAVQNIGINVDKDELLKALQYDRGQYQKGYADRDSEIVRCKDCRHGEMDTEHFIRPSIVCKNPANGVGHVSHRPDWFCADGERKEGR